MIFKKIQILFWETMAKIIDIRPRIVFPKHIDYPVAFSDKNSTKISYPEDMKMLLYEYEKDGKHWIIYIR